LPNRQLILNNQYVILFFFENNVELPLDRTKVRDALAQVQEFEGVTGKMAFKGTGDPVKSAVILQVKDGQFKYFASVQP